MLNLTPSVSVSGTNLSTWTGSRWLFERQASVNQFVHSGTLEPVVDCCICTTTIVSVKNNCVFDTYEIGNVYVYANVVSNFCIKCCNKIL